MTKHKQDSWEPPVLRQVIPALHNNWKQLTPQEQMKLTWQDIAKDFYLYCEKNLMITNKKGELVKLRPKTAQRKLVDAVMKDIKLGKPVRYIVLKARQLGLSTIIEAMCYWWAATHKYVNAAIVAQDKEASGNIYQMFQRYYDNSSPEFRPQTKYLTKNDLTFDVEPKPGQPNKGGLKSQIRTLVAKGAGTGRSQTNRFVHGSEVAFWEAGVETVAGLLQTVPFLPETFVFLESTANGMGGYFYDEWQFAKKGESTFNPFFFAWHEDPEYELNVPPKWGSYDADERELLKLFKDLHYPQTSWKRKLQWRREKMKEFRSDPERFYQEYPMNDMEAFISTGRPVFDSKALIRMDMKAARTKFQYIELSGNRKTDVKHSDVDFSPFKVWEKPEDNVKYVIGGDVAEGKEITANGKEGDYSVLTVIRRDNNRVVCRYRAHIDPDQFGDVACRLGWYYNEATIAIEVNNQGLATVQKIRDRLYRKMYMREKGFDALFEEPTAKMGWRTDKSSKFIMISELAKYIRDGVIIDTDIVAIREYMTYVRDDTGRTNAQEGHHDDCVMSTAIAVQLLDWKDLDREAPKPQTNVPNNRLVTVEKPTARQGIIKRMTKIKSR
jgi:hypothetical protein